MDYVYGFASSAILILGAFFVTILFFIIARKKFVFNEKFFLALLPCAVFGAAIRVLADKGILPYGGPFPEAGFFTHTPE